MKIIVIGGKSIVTKYAPATNTRGAAIVASVLDGGKPMLTARVPYPHELDEYGAHAAGARAALEKWKRNGLNAGAHALSAGLIGVGTATGYAFGFAAFAHEFDERGNVNAYRRNPSKRGAKRIPRAGVARKAYLARPSQITRKRPTKRLASRRRRNLAQGRAGFFPNPSRRVPHSAKVSRRRDAAGDWVVKFYDANGAHIPAADYFTPDLNDARATANAQTFHVGESAAPIKRNPRKRSRNLPGATGCTYVQVRRGAAWISVACSKRTGELGRAEAIKWAKDYAAKHPGRKVRVKWR